MRPEPALALRKSYRSILPLYSALTVKMRTLPTPIPFTQNSADVLTSDGLMSTICIEIEPGHVQPDLQFQVTNVRVSTRQSEGAYVSTNIDQLLAAQQDPDTYFPFQLERFAQHNLVYNIITSPSLTAGHLQTQYLASDRQVEHLRIDVDGFVTTLAYNSNNGHRGSVDGRVTSEFTSTWNTVLELRNAGTSAQSRIAVLRPIHDPTAVATDALPLSAAARSHSAQTTGSGGGLGKKFIPRNGSALHRDLVVSLSLIENSKRPSSSLSPGTGSPAHPYHRHAGLEQVTAYDTVDAEVTILNVSGRTVRLVLSDVEGPGSDRSQGGDPLPLVAGNQRSLTGSTDILPTLHNLPLSDLATPAPTPPARKPIIMLQNDLKLAPLLPRSCQSVRLRFMPLVPGPQRIPAFRLSDFERDQQVELQFEMYLQVK
ncbi:hypothetical protein QFC19_008578 [Naganishia cerealis]|uniref:Uncharacterized protein n=1 Tax=Naganishia cerealis TaxID=610337 RepID=A0ACC2V0Y7_9TREE|nr:hypothetical protein QFC19_008578 [Naganishia cerealis]